MAWIKPTLCFAALGLAVAVVSGCSRTEPAVEQPPPTKAEIWAAIQPRATRYRMDPAFIYALVAAESNFEPKARNGSARGLMQLMPAAWKAVSSRPYEPTVWDWRANLEAGIDYLAYTRSYLQKKKVPFSYPVLLASFHYGLDHMEDRRWDAGSVAVPDNPIYRELWRGNLTPVAVPR